MIVIAKTTSINVNASTRALLLLFTLLCVVALSRCRVVNLTFKNYCDPVNPVKRKRKNISVFSKISQRKCFKRKYFSSTKILTTTGTLMINYDELALVCIISICCSVTTGDKSRIRNRLTNIGSVS
jgi:hypothetical protein